MNLIDDYVVIVLWFVYNVLMIFGDVLLHVINVTRVVCGFYNCLSA